jgi:hypothetical protein
VERFDENGAMYHWKGIKAGDIVSNLFPEVSSADIFSYQEKLESH